MKETIKDGAYPRILVIRLSSLGDIVLSSPVYKNLKAKWPNSHITLLVKKQFADVLAGHPDIDEIITLKKTNMETVHEIKKRGFTHLLDLHSNSRSMIISALSGIPNKVKYNKNSVERRMFVKYRKQSPALEKHTLEKYLDALKAWDVPIIYKEPQLGDWAYKNAAAPEGKKVRKIGIFQTSFIGDTVLTTPLVTKTAKMFPDAKIVVITRPETKSIFEHMPEVSEIILNSKKGLSKITGVFKTAKEIKESGIDILLVPHRSFRSALIAWLSKVPIRIGFSSSEGWFFYTKTVPFSWMIHDAERNLNLLHGIVKENFQAEELNLKGIPTPDENVERLMEDYHLNGKTLVGVHPGSAWPTKCWPEEKYTQLIARLQNELGVTAVIVGGGKDGELGERIRHSAGGDAANLAGKTSLTDLMSIMRRFKLFVTNDSGPMHIATAFAVPTLAIFGPTTKELGFFPYGKGHRVIEVKGLQCRPCALHGGKKCPLGHFKCMNDITVDEVFNNAKEMLEENGVIEKK
ncbi:lipopolysaccharide heptosyltransferase II [Elusimicrobium simillimum]|uniref:lipopolysaccharide heptosyltransferase II n=1 Tax=Elusimicrobium simillimum TaxID=3143438 RepID=UPI003C6FD3F5